MLKIHFLVPYCTDTVGVKSPGLKKTFVKLSDTLLHKVRNRMGIFFVGRNCMQNSWWPCGVSKFSCWKHLYNGVDLVRFCNLPQKIYTRFSFFWQFFTYFHSAPPNMGVFGPFFAIRNDYHIIGDECGSSMVCKQPWFTCSFGLHALCNLLYWVQFVNTQGRVQNFIISCRLHGIIIPESRTL